MKALRFFILYRLYIALALIATGVVLHMSGEVITAWICYILAFVCLILYFMLGTMRLVQEAVTEGDPEQAMKYLNMIRFPRLLIKPVRSAYYFMQSNLALATKDYDRAEANIRKSMDTKSSLMGDTQGMSHFQLGTIAMQKGDMKTARINLKEAIRLGMPEKDNIAAAYLQLASIEIQRRQYRTAKEYFKKAKEKKPKAAELQSQIAEMEKYISRMPG